MVRRLAFLVVLFALAIAVRWSESTAQENDGKVKSGTVSGEFTSRKDINNGKSAVIEIRGDGEVKPRAYYVACDPRDLHAKGPFEELLKTVKSAQIGDRVQIEWHRPPNAEGNFIVKTFKIIKPADIKKAPGR